MTLLVDIVIAVVVLEAIALVIWRRAAILPNLAAGLSLLVAMRLALADAGLPWVGLALLLAGLSHAVDLYRTLASPSPSGRGPG